LYKTLYLAYIALIGRRYMVYNYSGFHIACIAYFPVVAVYRVVNVPGSFVTIQGKCAYDKRPLFYNACTRRYALITAAMIFICPALDGGADGGNVKAARD
jgi:hypothetical protein